MAEDYRKRLSAAMEEMQAVAVHHQLDGWEVTVLCMQSVALQVASGLVTEADARLRLNERIAATRESESRNPRRKMLITIRHRQGGDA